MAVCSLLGHRASPDVIANAGHMFSRCTRCSADLILVGAKWITPPKGKAIVWRTCSETEKAVPEISVAPALVVGLRAPERHRNNLRQGYAGNRRVAETDRRNFGKKVWNH